MASKKEKLYLIDGSSYIFRAYYAIQPLSTSKGLPTNALYGFTRMLLKLTGEEKPDMLAVVFDTREKTFRGEIYPEYKANRKEPPDDLIPQFPYFEPIVDALGIKRLSKPGFEADDVIGTIASRAEKEGYDVVIVTGDKDFMQLVSSNIQLYDTMKGMWIGKNEVKKRFGVVPERVVDVMSLIGDTSDNIPGVRGIGEKAAAALINQFGTLDNLLANMEKVSNKRARTALEEGEKNARLSRELVTIRCDVPLEYRWDDFRPLPPDEKKVIQLFSELEFYKLMREVVSGTESASASKKKDVSIISSDEDVRRLAAELKRAAAAAVYFIEGSETFPYAGVGISLGHDTTYYIPLSYGIFESVRDASKKVLSNLFDVLPSKKIFYDAKKTIKNLKKMEITVDSNLEDVGLMAYVLDPSLPSNLPTLAQKVLGIVTVADASQQATVLAEALYKLYEKFSDDLSKSPQLIRLYKDVEIPLSHVLLDMEEHGVAVDLHKLRMLSAEYGEKADALEKRIYEEAGEEFNISSPRQLGHILFEVMGIPSVKRTKTGFSTAGGVLEKLAHDHKIARLVMEYRSITKLKSTYIDVLPALAGSDGRIHTTYNQTVTATGRLSSSDPNLQNIPARTEEGRRIRGAFIAPAGYKLMSADYSQIELRILAHISEERGLMDAFHAGEDIHSATAARIYGVRLADVTKEMRRAAKTVNFGILYGQSAYGLSEELACGVSEAEVIIKSYYKNYSRVRELKEEILEGARKRGYVETLYGRRRCIPDIKSSNQQIKGFAERTAFNAVFQGTAADIIKMAMVGLYQVLASNFEKSRMILQNHDELVFEVHSSEVEQLREVVAEKMCAVAHLKVPLVVNIGLGTNWAECV